MRGSPSCVIVIRRFTVWRLGVGAVATAALVALLAWAFLAPPGPGAGIRIAALLAGLATVAPAASLWRVPAAILHWDGSGWALAGQGAPAAAPLSGLPEVAIDLGSFMLLRFTSREGARRGSVRWIPTQRRGLEAEWHALRCAVYSPRPAAGPAGAADPDFPE
jgi:hypothetical protein